MSYTEVQTTFPMDEKDLAVLDALAHKINGSREQAIMVCIAHGLDRYAANSPLPQSSNVEEKSFDPEVPEGAVHS